MNIYFAGSIRGGRDDKMLYFKLIDYLGKYGKVLTEHVGDPTLTEDNGNVPDDEWIYNRDTSWLAQADVIVAEVTTPSLGVGYEIASAENMDTKILCLFREGANTSLSAMINGNKNIAVKRYHTIKEAYAIIDEFFRK